MLSPLKAGGVEVLKGAECWTNQSQNHGKLTQTQGAHKEGRQNPIQNVVDLS